MCGVAGIVHTNQRPVDAAHVRRMTDAIAHRGPDGEGLWIEGPVGIGHRRLSIIDLSDNATQPMHSTDGRYVLSYNGEIYNFRELRRELEALGHVFRSTSDAEVLLASCVEWGTHAILKFNGMFAFALWDRKAQTLLLARDRYGIKPLYYRHDGERFSFASEHKAILTLGGSAALDRAALYEYFTFQNLFTDRTLIQGISMLPAGHYAVLDMRASTPALAITRYWDFHFREPDHALTIEEYREELHRLFQQAVERQLVADVELGSYLSGGIDSGSITAIAAAKMPNLKTFTCGFDLSSASGIELAYDERVQAEAMSARFKTEHYEMVLKAGDMERALPSLAWHLEEPRVGQSYPNYYAAKLASKFVKVVLSGSGGDELFGGYPWRYYRAASSDNFEHYIDQYYSFWQRLLPESDIHNIFAPIACDVAHVSTRDIFRDVFDNHSNTLRQPEDYINHSLYFEAKTFLHGLLVVEDKLSMAHGLESRVPFLDNDLVDFAMQCPVRFKLNNLSESMRINENEALDKKGRYFKKTNDGKQILRDVMRRYIPAETTDAIKQGFSAPDASWFKGESIDFVRKQLFEGSPRIYEFLDGTAVRALVDDHLQGRQNRRLFIWSLLNLEAFLAAYGG